MGWELWKAGSFRVCRCNLSSWVRIRTPPIVELLAGLCLTPRIERARSLSPYWHIATVTRILIEYSTPGLRLSPWGMFELATWAMLGTCSAGICIGSKVFGKTLQVCWPVGPCWPVSDCQVCQRVCYHNHDQDRLLSHLAIPSAWPVY